MKLLLHRIGWALCAIALVSCANAPQKSAEELALSDDARYQPKQSVNVNPDQDQADADAKDKSQNEVKPFVHRGSGQFVTAEKALVKNEIEDEGEITLNFEGVDLREVIKVIFEEILHKNYLIDPQVAGTVTIHTTHAVGKTAVMPILETILDINGAALVNNGSVYKIVPQAGLKSVVSMPVLGKDQKLGMAGHSIQVVPLQYIAAAEMKKLLDSVVATEGAVQVDEGRNLLILTGSYGKIDQLLSTIRMFDVDWLKGMSLGMFPLQYTDSKTLVAELEQVLGNDGKGPLAGIVRMIPIERLNAVLVITHQPRYIEEARRLIEQFDLGVDQSSNQRLYVYRLEHGKAENIASILQSIYGQETVHETSSAAASTTSRNRSNITTPTMQNAYMGGAGVKPMSLAEMNKVAMNKEVETPPPVPVDRSSSPNSEQGGSGAFPATIIADTDNNAILVLASPQDYRGIKSTIRQLDVEPRQVLIEATIAEVELNDGLSHGVRWFFDNAANGKHVRGGLGVPLPSSVSSSTDSSFALGIFNSANELRFFFDILETESSVKFLSAPQIMVVDNQTASFRVGDQIPVTTRSSQSTTNPDAPIVTEVQYIDTGTLLQVTPRINAGGMVTLEINQEVSKPGAVPAVGGGGNVPIAQRTIDSTVIVHDGQTVVLGGMIRENTQNSNGGVPILRSVPGLTYLFSNTSKDVSRNELIITLTPRVVTNPNEAYELSKELRIKLKDAAAFSTTGIKISH